MIIYWAGGLFDLRIPYGQVFSISKSKKTSKDASHAKNLRFNPSDKIFKEPVNACFSGAAEYSEVFE